MREDAFKIIKETIADVLPDRIVRETMQQLSLKGAVYIVAIGKAAWIMADTAAKVLGSGFQKGVIVTKYGHSKGSIEHFQIIEAGHPVPDENSILGAEKILEMFQEIPSTAIHIIFDLRRRLFPGRALYARNRAERYSECDRAAVKMRRQYFRDQRTSQEAFGNQRRQAFWILKGAEKVLHYSVGYHWK